MSLLTTPGKRWTDPKEDSVYDSLDLTAQPTVTIEPETVGLNALVLADIGAIAATAPVGTKFTITTSGPNTVTTRTMLELSDGFALPAGTTIDQLIEYEQLDQKVVYRGFVQLVDNGDGTTSAKARVQAVNLALTDQTINAATAIRGILLGGPIKAQPNIPNAQLVVTPGKRWQTANEPISVLGLNQTAAPTAAIAPGSIKRVELNSADMRITAARYAGLRATFVTSGSTNIVAGAIATLGTSTVTGAVAGDIVRIAQPSGAAAPGAPLFTGYVSGANTVTVQGRNNAFGTVNVANGTTLKIVVFH